MALTWRGPEWKDSARERERSGWSLVAVGKCHVLRLIVVGHLGVVMVIQDAIGQGCARRANFVDYFDDCNKVDENDYYC